MARRAADDDLITKVEQHLYQAGDFSDTETQALREIVQAWKGLLILGKAAKWIIVALGLVAALVASMGALKDAFRGWLS